MKGNGTLSKLQFLCECLVNINMQKENCLNMLPGRCSAKKEAKSVSTALSQQEDLLFFLAFEK